MSTGAPQPVVLFVDDEPDLVDIARACFEHGGWYVHTADNIADAKDVLASHRVDVILSDIMMQGGSGIELLEWTRANCANGHLFYLLTGCIDERVTLARSKGANGVFNKPCDWLHVVKALREAISSRQLKS